MNKKDGRRSEIQQTQKIMETATGDEIADGPVQVKVGLEMKEDVGIEIEEESEGIG
jgi:hypothetical protein